MSVSSHIQFESYTCTVYMALSYDFSDSRLHMIVHSNNYWEGRLRASDPVQMQQCLVHTGSLG